MRSAKEVEDMLAQFDNADEDGQLDCDGEATKEALMWVLGHRTDDDLTQLLPEEDTEGDDDEDEEGEDDEPPNEDDEAAARLNALRGMN